MIIHVLISYLSFFFILEPAGPFHARTPNASYKLHRTGYHCQFAKCLSSNTAHKKKSQRKVKIHLLVRRQMWTHWEAVRALSSRVWFIITQLLKHSAQMQADSTSVTVKDFDTYWSQGKDKEWWRCSERLEESLSLPNTVITPAQPVLACSLYLLKINSEIVYDTILSAFIPSNCFLWKIILIVYPPWNKLSEWKITSGLQSD